MTALHPSLTDLPMPPRVARLPRDQRGFPVPWFVAWVEGHPDHRCIDGRKMHQALQEKRCWICGEPLGRMLAFLLGPMCVVSRTVSEPPSHQACAEYAVKACPFLARPHAHRREAGLPEECEVPAGLAITRNPGVTCLWITRRFQPLQASAGRPGLLFQVGEAIETSWYAEGRTATHAEVMASLESGIPLQHPLAAQQGPLAEQAYALALVRALRYVPAEEEA